MLGAVAVLCCWGFATGCASIVPHGPDDAPVSTTPAGGEGVAGWPIGMTVDLIGSNQGKYSTSPIPVTLKPAAVPAEGTPGFFF